VENYSVPAEAGTPEAAESVVAGLFEWAIHATWVVAALAVIARLLVLLPWFADLRSSSTFPGRMKRRGLAVVVVAGVVAALAYDIGRWRDEAPVEGVAISIALVAVIVGLAGSVLLSFGFATAPRVDAKVLQPDGSANDAWAIDVLTQINSAHREGATHSAARANRNNRADLGDVIKVADRTGNGVAVLVAWFYQLFFNVSPWLVQVTLLDGLNASATLRRNGHQIDEVSLQLQFGDAAQDNHRKLLSMGASFAAMGVAAKYYDIKGFYGVETWRSAAYVSLAMQTVDEERRIYIERALAEEPTNLVAECEEVTDAFDDETDAAMLWERMDRLEPMIDVAARLCGEPDVIGVPGSLWHQRPADGTEARPANKDFDQPEPPLMMLRLMDWYLGSVSNWIALTLASDGTLASGEGREPSVEERRQRVGIVLARFVDTLARIDAEREIDERPEIGRLQMVAAMDDDVLAAWAEPEYTFDAALRLADWGTRASDSVDQDMKFYFACALAHRYFHTGDADERSQLSGAIVDLVDYAKFNPYWRDWTFKDPELRLLGHEDGMRSLALSAIDGAWQIDRFRPMLKVPAARPLADPGMITEDVLDSVRATTRLKPDVLQSIADGARILRASRTAKPEGWEERDVLRAARHILDEAGHDVISLRLTSERDLGGLVDDVAAAVYWVPDPIERVRAAGFLVALLEHIAPRPSDAPSAVPFLP
jgi:hypothetical protein